MYNVGGGHLQNKKAFTLIELLAVIVILAIIALIATPIILNIISSSKESAKERSAELYKIAVLNAVVKKQLNGITKVPEGTYTVQEDGSICKEEYCIPVEVEGERPSKDSTITIKDGEVTEYSFTINGKVITNVVYLWYDGEEVEGPTLNEELKNTYYEKLETDNPYYLKFKYDKNNIVTNAYACARFNGEEYCVQGGRKSKKSFYGYADNTGNVAILKDLQTKGLSCDFSSSTSSCCDAGSVELCAYSVGHVNADDAGGFCGVHALGSGYCEIY